MAIYQAVTRFGFVFKLEKQLSSYDAAYLELALRRQLPIASLDKQINRVAKELGLAVL